MKDRKNKEEELYQIYKAEMEQEERDDSSSESSSYSPKGGRNVAGFSSTIEGSAKKSNKRPALESSLDADFDDKDTKKML